jgi:GxxExxY protein
LRERSEYQNEPLILSIVEPGGHPKQLIRYIADKMYVDFNKESGENGEGERDPLTQQVIGCAIEVHRNLGPGLLESTYEKCLAHELKLAGLSFINQVSMPIDYKGITLDSGYRLDFLIDDYLVVELKAVEQLLPIHQAQLITYMKLAEAPVGLLINFNVKLLKDGIRRLFPSPSQLSLHSL